MARTSLIQVRVDNEVKQESDVLFADLGIDTPTAVRIFLNQAIKQRRLPFDVSQTWYNADTVAAINESEEMLRDKNLKTYSNFSELLQEVQTELSNEV